MRISYFRLAIALVVPLLFSACNLPGAPKPNSDFLATSVAATLSVMQTNAVIPPTAPPPTDTATPTLPATGLPTMIAPTPQNPLVVADALCWVGPGNVYEVVSAIKKGTRVELLGRGSLAGWWVVRNPIYHDPCWIQDSYLQFDPGYNLSGLQIFYPPPTPTFTPSATPTP